MDRAHFSPGEIDGTAGGLTNWDAEELSRMVSPGIPTILER